MHRLNTGSFCSHFRALVGALACVTFVVACKGNEPATGDSTVVASASGAAASEAAAGSSMGRIHLEVSGGANAGTYDVEMKDGGCSYGLAGDDVWGNQYSVDAKNPNQLSSLQLVVPNAKAASNGTSEFQLTAQFGPLFGEGGHSYDVNTQKHTASTSGSGTVTVQDQGKTGKVTFDVKTADGVGLKGTVDCQSVMRNG